MTKFVLGILTLAAFLFAAYVVLLKRPMPDPEGATGLRRRFLLAVILACAVLSAPGGLFTSRPALADDPVKPVAFQEDEEPSRSTFLKALREIWRTLDPKKSGAFRREARNGADSGLIRRKVASMLSTMYHEISTHVGRTKGAPRRTCYRMTSEGMVKKKSRDQALKQLELLWKARDFGTLDEKTAQKARAALAREIEAFHRAGVLETGDRKSSRSLWKLAGEGKIKAGDAATEAASIVVELEGGPPWGKTPAQRLGEMQKRVESLFTSGPAGNDWGHPALGFDLHKALSKAGLIPAGPRMTCYTPRPGPMIHFDPLRSQELRKLQAELLDRNVKAGILPVELAEKIAAAEARGEKPDLVKEKDIASYQKKIRRIARLLLGKGEITSAFVRRVEGAIDLSIAVFDERKALRHDVAFQLRPVLATGLGRAAEKALVEKDLIPDLGNHRWLRDGPANALSGDDKDKLALFTDLISGDAPFELPDDKKILLRSWDLPGTHAELRRELRRAARALVVAGITNANSLRYAAGAVGIPLVGRIR